MAMFKFLVIAMMVPSFSFAAPLTCTGKRLNQANSEYGEQALKVSIDHDGSFAASTTINDCYFSVQSRDSITYQVVIMQTPDSGYLSTYASPDPKGNLIMSYNKDKGNFVCMLVCSKPAQK